MTNYISLESLAEKELLFVLLLQQVVDIES